MPNDSCAWFGRSGEKYLYRVHQWPARLTGGPANYIFCYAVPDGLWQPLLIGECGELSELSPAAPSYMTIAGLLVTHVHVRLNPNPCDSRRREVEDLVEHWNPPGN